MRIEILLISLLFYCSTKAFKPSGLKEAEKYLADFYDYNIESGSIEEPLKKFQTFAGIEQNGVLSDEVIAHMSKPRCGKTDVVKKSKRYNLHDVKWDSGVTYRYFLHQDWLPRTMSLEDVRRALTLAHRYWSKVSNIDFTENPSTYKSKFSLSFAGKTHKLYDVDNKFQISTDPFDLDNVPGNVLAHAYPPKNGNVHFDNAETWTEGKSSGINLRIVAAHEIGHALGLQHSDLQGALMYPMYQGFVSEQEFKLPDDDTRGIRELYGSRGKRTLISKSPKPGKAQSKFCQAKEIESVFKSSDERFYMIADDFIFRVDGTNIDETFTPIKAPKHFKNADSMFYDKKGKRLIILKGQDAFSLSGNDIHNLQIKKLSISAHGAYVGKSSAAFIREQSADRDMQYFWIIQENSVISGELYEDKVIFSRRSEKLSDVLEMTNGARLPTNIDGALIAGEKDKLRLYVFVGNSYYAATPGGRKQFKYFIPAEYPKTVKSFFHC